MKHGFIVRALMLFLSVSAASVAATPAKSRYVPGAGDVPLSVVEYGNPNGPPILFIHGMGQSSLSFEKQLHSTLAAEYRLVAFDLRGHGNSGKPWIEAAYADSRVWADDVARVMAATGLVKPVLVTWSFGTVVAANYLRHYGGDNVQGMVMIGALGGLAPLRPGDLDMNAPVVKRYVELQAAVAPLAASAALEDNLAAIRMTIGFLNARPMPPEWVDRAVMISAMVPQFIRPWLIAQFRDNSDLVPNIRFPLLLLAGSEDYAVPKPLMEHLAASLPDIASVSVYAGTGHSPFLEEPERFNRELEAFMRRARSRP